MVLHPDPAAAYTPLFHELDPPYEDFDDSKLGPEFPLELKTVSGLWFKCGYRPGIAFSSEREKMERFARAVEAAHAGLSPHLEKHAKHILALGEMVGASSAYDSVASFLPEKTRAVFQPIYHRVRPTLVRRWGARLLGRILMKQAIGEPRVPVPYQESQKR